MEKNGYIFIKQNFESLDTEPTLTEISEIPVTAVADDVALKTEAETGNQLLKVNGKMVYLQMENKPLVVQTGSHSNTMPSESTLQPNLTNNGKGRKLVAKKDTGTRRLANILKSGGTKKSTENISSSPSKRVSVSKPTLIPGTGSMPLVQRLSNTEPFTLVPVMSGTSLPVVQNNTNAFIIPVSMLQVPQQHSQPLIMSTNNTNVSTFTESNTVNDTCATVTGENLEQSSTADQQVIEVQPITVNIDEKGAASDLICTQGNTSTPIVSDAPWQGIVNINSEQELLEYINSQSTSGLESDQGMTILIQNVENGAVMSLDSQNILAGSTNISVFQDQSTILSDVLPVSGNITEVQVQTDGSTSECLNSNDKIVHESNTFDKPADDKFVEMAVVKEEGTDSDDAGSQVMLTEANREHLSDQDDDFTSDHDEKMLIKSDPDEFSDHAMYTANEVKCEIDVKSEDIMETEATVMVIDDHCTDTEMENCADYKGET